MVPCSRRLRKRGLFELPDHHEGTKINHGGHRHERRRTVNSNQSETSNPQSASPEPPTSNLQPPPPQTSAVSCLAPAGYAGRMAGTECRKHKPTKRASACVVRT